MHTRYLFFAASRYWPDTAELDAAYRRLCAGLVPAGAPSALVIDGAVPPGAEDTLVIIPMSGAVQQDILRAAEGSAAVVLYAAYVRGNADDETAARMLTANAAPTLMDCWSVLRKAHTLARLALDAASLARLLRVLDAWHAARGATLLLLGDTEPWVVSASRDLADYARLGIHIKRVPLAEVAARYEQTTDAAGAPYAEAFARDARETVEPTAEDLRRSGRMTAALLGLLEEHGARGMAIACFNLLSLGVTACLAVSYINDHTDKVAACEGDLDSACSLLLLKGLARTKLWMANPGLNPGGLVNFSHCTAPVDIDGAGGCAYVLRNHHESGIGASLQVALPAQRRVTAFRLSARHGVYTVQGGVSEAGPYEAACRTQLYVRFDDFDAYIRTALGCHQVFAFEDLREDAAELAELMGLVRET